MNLSGTVRIDWASHVRHHHLVVDDECLRALFHHLGDGSLPVDLHIGDATRVDFLDDRAPTLLAAAPLVHVIGSHADGVAHTLRSLSRFAEAAA